MIVKSLKRLFLILLILLVAAALLATISSSFSLDRSFAHTNATAQLPRLAEDSSAELVRIEANGFEFRARILGNNRDLPTVIFLHGFPATSAMWEPLLPSIASSGYRVIAFDQRGYSPGARPQDPAAYTVPLLVSDVIAIADAVGADQFHLVGHDWGAAIGWSTVMQHPDRVLSWTGISIAHPSAFADALANDADQQARSRYFGLFTMPWLPETLFTLGDLTLLMAAYEGMLEEQREEYRAVFSEPGALTSALNWYRQMQSSLLDTPELDPYIETPTLFIWGNDDPSAGRAAVVAQEQYMQGPYSLLELAGGHWLITSHGNVIDFAIREHLGSY